MVSAPGLSIIDIMRALQVNEYGGPEKLVVADAPVPEPQAGEVLVKMAAAGVCHSDYHIMKGEWGSPLPVVLGHEGAGVVERRLPVLSKSLALMWMAWSLASGLLTA